jgi:CRISPR-associated protein Csx17
MNRLRLEGCSTQPLASYLKALAVFRITAEQADHAAAGFWRDGAFVLETELDIEGLIDFILNRYRPTPIVSPWNAGSGFWPHYNCEGMDRILHSDDPRFDDYREVIRQIKEWPELDMGLGSLSGFMGMLRGLVEEGSKEDSRKARKHLEALEKILADAPVPGTPETNVAKLLSWEVEAADEENAVFWKRLRKIAKKGVRTLSKTLSSKRLKRLKENLGVCRARLPERALRWFDAAVAITSGESHSYFPLLGTGGNDGNQDFSRNFMSIAGHLLLDGGEATKAPLRATLLDTPVSGLDKWSIGQFDPGRAGGYNMGYEVETKKFKINPWDYLLTFEGALLLAASATRRSTSEPWSKASLPFTVDFSPVGFTSGSDRDDDRSETWLPTWSSPATLGEVAFLFAEGRSSLGRRQARNGIDFCRAVGQLGVDRGLSSFTRYVFLKRRGRNYVALPAGEVDVAYRPELALLDELDPVLQRMDGFLRRYGDHVPAALSTARRRIEEELFQTSRRPSSLAFARLVRALGRFEMRLSRMDHGAEGFLARPLSGLSAEWVRQCLPSCPEAPLAASLASIRGEGGVGPMRSNTSGVDPRRPWEWGDSQQCWNGSSLPERMISALSRRLLEMGRTNTGSLPLGAMLKVASRQVSPFVYGLVDDSALEELLYGFTLVAWKSALRAESPVEEFRRPLSRSWALLKLMMTSGINHPPAGREGMVLRLAAAGRVSEACDLAASRLRHVAELPVLPLAWECDCDPARLAAALLFPVWDTDTLKSLVLKKEEVQQ